MFQYRIIHLSKKIYLLTYQKRPGNLELLLQNLPLDYKCKFVNNITPLINKQHYQRLVGWLIYLTITRPDIAYTVNYISQFMHALIEGHMALVDRILRYLKSSPGRGILMKKHGHTCIVGYIDIDWAGSPVDRKSTTYFWTFIGDNLVTWKNKKQTVVARSSSVEAEYRAIALITSEMVWL